LGGRIKVARSLSEAMPYDPEAGHLIWTDFDPQIGREQTGRRAALVATVPAAEGPRNGIVGTNEGIISTKSIGEIASFGGMNG